MFTAIRTGVSSRVSSRAFSSSAARRADMAKLVLIGRLGRDPEIRVTKNDKEFVSYTVATTNYPAPPANADGSRPSASTTWHHVLSFNPGANNYLRTLPKGAHVYVEANYELREADPAAEASSPQSQRQIFLRHENIRVLKYPVTASNEESS